jgi:DNA recombination protein RmuC
MNTMTILFFIIAIAAVAAVIFLIMHNSSERAKLAQDFNDEKARMAKEYNDKLDEYQDRLSSLNGEKAALESRLASREEYERMLKEQHDKELAQMKESFRVLTADNSEIFKKQSAESIGELLKPIQEKFSEFGKAVKESQDKATEQSAQLRQHIEDVIKQSKDVGDEARNLANALTGKSKVQGNFGEMALVDDLKNAGLVEGVHFVTQRALTDENGQVIKSESNRAMIPDAMVYYPDNTLVIIDSKVSLTDYTNYMNAQTDEDREKFARQHVDSVRGHVEELAGKDYAAYIPESMRKVDYNIMYIPNDSAFLLMLQKAPSLWQEAMNKNVLIVSHVTLIVVLNMIQMAWKQAEQNKNIADVYKTGSELMSALQAWMKSFADVGDNLRKATDAYNEATFKLKDSRQSVIQKIQKLESLSLAPKRGTAKGTLPTSGTIIPSQLQTEEKQ